MNKNYCQNINDKLHNNIFEQKLSQRKHIAIFFKQSVRLEIYEC